MPKEEVKKKLSAIELKTQAEQEFVDKYNALCDEYGLVITPQLTLKVVPRN